MKNRRLLLWSRRAAAFCVFVAFALLFALPNRFFPEQFAWLASLQIVPAILAGSAAILCALALSALIFGRLYCSTLCPLGILQDCVGLLRKKRPFSPRRRLSWLSYAIFAIFALALVFGLLLPVGLLDPYSAFGRIMTNLFAPPLEAAHNLLALGAEKLTGSPFAPAAINFPEWIPWLVACATFLPLFCLTLKAGRVWCDYCPAGTALGFLARKSPLRIRLNPEKCVNCGRCERVCKTGCVNLAKHEVDNGRCVNCFRCVSACPKDAITYALPAKSRASDRGMNKRAFLLALLAWGAAGSPTSVRAASGQEINRPDVIPRRRKPRSRPEPIIPPGARDLSRYEKRCVGCQLCVSACPNKVLGVSANGPGLLQPGMSYEFGYCRPNCTVCGEVCPTGAIEPITAEAKKLVQIGRAGVDYNLCLVFADKTRCTACHRICPAQAISLEPLGQGELAKPAIDANKCTGCGACEYICPAMPLAAIAVSGNREHARI